MDGQREQESEQLQRRLFSNAESKASAAPSSVAKLASLALGRATTTRCIPPGHRCRRLRNSSRSRRRTAFRTTAVPTLLDTVSPSRDVPSGLGDTRPTRGPAVTFFPRSWTSRKSRRLRRRTSLGNAARNPTSWPQTRPAACGPWPADAAGRPGRLGCCSASGSRGSGSASTWTAGTCASTRLETPSMTAIRFSGEGRAHNPGLAIESMRVVERIAEQARSGALFLIPNRPREVVQHAPRPPRHRTGGFPPEVASRVGFSRAVARARKRR